MATSEVSISNLALSYLGGNLIISLDDGTPEANLCKANFEECRDAVLEDRDWTFAKSRLALAPSASLPAFEYSYKFELPSDIIRVLKASDDPEFKNDLDWIKEGKFILANTTVLYVKFIKQVTDPTLFSKGFTQALAARLAMEIALPMTNSPEMQQRMQSLYGTKLERAGTMDGMQGKNVLLETCRLIQVR